MFFCVIYDEICMIPCEFRQYKMAALPCEQTSRVGMVYIGLLIVFVNDR